MKQYDQFTLNQRRQVWSFVQVAPVAGHAEIGLMVRTTMLPSNDVLDVEREERLIVLMASTILAPVIGTLSNKSTSGSINGHRG